MSEEVLHGFTCEFVREGDTCKLIDVLVDENRRLRDERDTCCDFVDTVVHPDFPGQLQAENAKLRERIAELEDLLPDSQRWFSADTVEAYVAEIAKLRELARDMYERFYGVVIENWSYSTEDFQMYERRMRELGVEL